MAMKTVLGLVANPHGHWVGDGFPVRSLFSYDCLGSRISPFLLFDFVGPHHFEPSDRRRGVGEHPHRGFETVSIVYEGEVSHRDSAGNSGTIGPGDVQWMTAGSGVLHDEFHSTDFTRRGGAFLGIQLWVNLPAVHKMSEPAYQTLTAGSIPVVELADGSGAARVIAGEFEGVRGAARTFTPVNIWDIRIDGGVSIEIPLPDRHNSIAVVISGQIMVEGGGLVTEGEGALFSREGQGATISAQDTSGVLILTGEPINEPLAGYGPFVMNTKEQIRDAFEDLNAGRFGHMSDAREA